ncbi:Rz1-like lysis system protein LysC [Escherichia coli]
MLCAGCTSAPPAPTPVIVHNACPKVSLCPMPGSDPETNGDLSADMTLLTGNIPHRTPPQHEKALSSSVVPPTARLKRSPQHQKR